MVAALAGAGHQAHSVAGDVSTWAGASAMVGEASKVLGGLHILVNNAGIIGSSLIEDTEPEEWRRVMAVNLDGPFYCSKAAIPHMKGNGWGRIVNASSMYGIVPEVGRAHYCVSKAGVAAFTRVLAAELGPYGITVNAYAPGTIETRMSADAVQNRAEEKLRGIHAARFGTVWDVANLVAFICSPEADYITGSILPVDGGALAVQSPWKARRQRPA